jgi:restriction endonuclease S subunit
LSSPFNEQKYKGLLEGLKISEVKLKDVIKGNDEFRIDSDFFKKEILSAIEFISNKPHDKLRELVSDIKSFGAYSLCNSINFMDKTDTSIPYIRCLNIKNGILNFNDVLYIDKRSNELLWKSEIKPQMVLVTMSGTVGNATVALEQWKYPINSNQDIAKIEVCKINPFYLSTFLNTKYGYSQMIRLQAGAIQQHLYLSQIEKIIIPKVNLDFQNQIEYNIKNAHLKREQSQQLYQQAEELLLEAIGINKGACPLVRKETTNVNIKSFRESFLTTGRLDAEYYQPKYEEIIGKIKEQQYDLLGNLVTIQKSIEPGSDVYSDEGLPFLRVADYNKFGFGEPEKKLADSFCKDNQALIEKLKPEKETILFTKDGTVGTAYLLREDADFITSGAILHLKVKDTKRVLPEYLTLALNSQLVQMQAERDAGGSIILHWRVGEIEKVVVPIVDYNVQQQIAELVEKSFYLRRESERLLEEAKVMVEREIEKNNYNEQL